MQRTGQVTPVAFNVDRCVELHNAIIQISSNAPSHPPLQLVKYLEHYAEIEGDNIGPATEFMSDVMVNFLSQCDIIPDESQNMTPWTLGLTHLSELWDSELLPPRGEYNDCVLLYRSSTLADDSMGLVFDLVTNKATWMDSIYDTPPDYTEHVWVPLEEILEAWLFYLRRGRCTPRSVGQLFPPGGDEGGWSMVYHPEQDVQETLEVWDKYVGLVESRLPGSSQMEDTNPRPGFGEAFTGFAREFFSQARVPAFKYVAPELVYPTPAQMVALASRQQIPDTPYIDNTVPPLAPTVIFPLGEDIHAGLCNADDVTWQDGVGLVLPSSVGYQNWVTGVVEDAPRFEKVWQCQPRDSPYWPSHPARFATVLRKWIEFVEAGIWSVGLAGIEGTLGQFLVQQGSHLTGMYLDGVDTL